MLLIKDFNRSYFYRFLMLLYVLSVGSCNNSPQDNKDDVASTRSADSSSKHSVDTSSTKNLSTMALTDLKDKNVTFINSIISRDVIDDFKKQSYKKFVTQFSIVSISSDEITLAVLLYGQTESGDYSKVYTLTDEKQSFKVPVYLPLTNQFFSAKNLTKLFEDGTGTERTDYQYISLIPTFDPPNFPKRWLFQWKPYYYDLGGGTDGRPGRSTIPVFADPSPPAPSYSNLEELLNGLTKKQANKPKGN